MKTFRGQTIQSCYRKLIRNLKRQKVVGNTKEINNCCLVVKHPSLDNYKLPFRKISEKYILSELAWYWSADNSCETIGKHASMWLNISDDGKTNNSAYGYILFKKYGFNQLEQVIELLKKDKNSRRAVLNISDPAINRIKTKDMQCTIAVQFLIRNDKLDTTVYMRSNDVYFGLPYDYFFFMTLANYVASQLGIEVGTYTHHATSMHLYLRDLDKFKAKKTKTLNIDFWRIIYDNYTK